DRQDEQRAAPVEVAVDLLVQRDGLGLVADVVAQGDADVVAALAGGVFGRPQAGREAAGADLGRDFVDLAAVDLHADHLDGIAHRFHVDLYLGAAGAQIRPTGRRDDAELRHRPGRQVGQLEGVARRPGDRLLRRGKDDGLLHDVRAIEVRAQLIGADIVGRGLGPLVHLPTDDGVGAGRAHVVALRGPHYPFAVDATEQRSDQLARLKVPQ